MIFEFFAICRFANAPSIVNQQDLECHWGITDFGGTQIANRNQQRRTIFMADPTSVADLDLTPLPGKQYFTLDREWREEFIYFLLVDRFHDDRARSALPQAARSTGIPAPNDFYGGTIKGITQHL